MKNANILLIGCGPHAKRVYLPILKEMQRQNVYLKAVVEINDKKDDVTNVISKDFENVELLFISPFQKQFTHKIPNETLKALNNLVIKHNINGVIIATDPLHHIQYAIWAMKHNLHILMDKPISTYSKVANSIKQSKQIEQDYKILMSYYKDDYAFIINAQRRFLPQFDIVQNFINEVAYKYGVPVTSIQSTHSDGQWRLPNEVLTIKYHPLLGWGKVSHSGFHFIDMASKLVIDSYSYANKFFDNITVYSKFIRPSGVLKMQNQDDLEKIWGNKYKELDNRSNEELLSLFKKNKEAEVDAYSLICLKDGKSNMTTISLNLIHNGFSCRSWLLPNMQDLYKGNGRVRHEYHNIIQGNLQNIQIHSYQSKSNHDINKDEDTLIGGNNHYDIYIFRNGDILKCKPLTIITEKQIAKEYNIDNSKVLNEVARHNAVKQFIDVIQGKLKASETKSNIKQHYWSTKLMSLIYQSGRKEREIKKKCGNK